MDYRILGGGGPDSGVKTPPFWGTKKFHKRGLHIIK